MLDRGSRRLPCASPSFGRHNCRSGTQLACARSGTANDRPDGNRRREAVRDCRMLTWRRCREPDFRISKRFARSDCVRSWTHRKPSVRPTSAKCRSPETCGRHAYRLLHEVATPSRPIWLRAAPRAARSTRRPRMRRTRARSLATRLGGTSRHLKMTIDGERSSSQASRSQRPPCVNDACSSRTHRVDASRHSRAVSARARGVG